MVVWNSVVMDAGSGSSTTCRDCNPKSTPSPEANGGSSAGVGELPRGLSRSSHWSVQVEAEFGEEPHPVRKAAVSGDFEFVAEQIRWCGEPGAETSVPGSICRCSESDLDEELQMGRVVVRTSPLRQRTRRHCQSDHCDDGNEGSMPCAAGARDLVGLVLHQHGSSDRVWAMSCRGLECEASRYCSASDARYSSVYCSKRLKASSVSIGPTL